MDCCYGAVKTAHILNTYCSTYHILLGGSVYRCVHRDRYTRYSVRKKRRCTYVQWLWLTASRFLAKSPATEWWLWRNVNNMCHVRLLILCQLHSTKTPLCLKTILITDNDGIPYRRMIWYVGGECMACCRLGVFCRVGSASTCNSVCVFFRHGLRPRCSKRVSSPQSCSILERGLWPWSIADSLKGSHVLNGWTVPLKVSLTNLYISWQFCLLNPLLVPPPPIGANCYTLLSPDNSTKFTPIQNPMSRGDSSGACRRVKRPLT